MKLQAKIETLNGLDFLPDQFIWKKNDSLHPDDSFVISRNASGEVISRYGDTSLDLTPYSTTGPATFNSISWCPENEQSSELAIQISEEIKKLFFIFMYFSPTPLAIGTLRGYGSNLRRIANIARRAGKTLTTCNSDNAFAQQLKESMSCASYSVLNNVHRLYTKYFEIQARFPEIDFGLNAEQLTFVSYYLNKSERKTDQTPLIPTRIYSSFIEKLTLMVDQFLEHSDAIHEFYRRRFEDDQRYGLKKGSLSREGLSDKGATLFDKAIKELHLEEYFCNHDITGNPQIQSHLSKVQLACKWIIHIFSAMRDNEVKHLPFYSLDNITIDNNLIWVIKGSTSKLTEDGYKPTFWITAPEATHAHKVAQKIAQISFLRLGINDPENRNVPLFPTQNSALVSDSPYFEVPLAKLGPDLTSTLLEELDIRINESDVEELEMFDGFRDWRSEEKFSIGSLWPFTTHQARRSLTVYAARSKLVSLGALSFQLKHITEVMTSYYSRNSSFAKNFVVNEDQQTLINEFEVERQISEFLDFDANVINSPSALFGGGGIKLQKMKDSNNLPSFLCDREETLRRFKNGELTYKRTLFGGCINTEDCDKIAFISVISCLDCAHAIFDERSYKKMQIAAENIETKKNMYEPSSPYYRQLSNEGATVATMLNRMKTSIPGAEK